MGLSVSVAFEDLSILFKKISGFQGEIKWDHSKPDGTLKKLLDVTRIKKLGWAPKINLKKGIKDNLEIYRDLSIRTKNFS